MLIGAHVSVSGGLKRSVERGIETASDAIQIFHQSPRMWRPTAYSDQDLAEFRAAFDDSPLRAAVIHAVYLINCASKERETRSKSIKSLTHALRVGDGIEATGVVLHAGARKGEPHAASMERASKAIATALSDSDHCRVLLENTAGTQGPLGRNFDELAALLDLLDGDDRVGICLDCCHLLASGFEIRTADALASVVDEFEAKVGLDRLTCLHINDSKVPLGANRDHHANLGEGELGDAGLRTFLSEPRFEGLPALLEVPGPNGHGPDRDQVEIAKRLRKRGLEARRRSRR
jgi:deoxyribonuclease-4